MFLGAFAFAMSGLRERRDADARLDDAQAALVAGRQAATDADADLASAQATVTKLASNINAVVQGANIASKLDVQEAALYQAAVQAGMAGDVGGFNQAVGQRNAISAPHDAALDGLRAPVDALMSGLDALSTNR